MSHLRLRAPLCAILLALLACTAAHADGHLLVFGAASLKDALNAAIQRYEASSDVDVKASYASSGTLAQQLAHGAPADVYISANVDWMDYLQKQGDILPDSRFDLLGNGLVLVAPRAADAPSIRIEHGFDLAGILGDGHLAMGNPRSVPAGMYGKAALETLGVWQQVEPKVVRADNVRAALALVDRGEAPLGIVYRSDAVADHGVQTVARFPEDSHPPIIYPAARMKGSAETGKAFLAFLRSPRAAPIFQRYGFRVLAHGAG